MVSKNNRKIIQNTSIPKNKINISTYRSRFNTWKRSKEAFEVSRSLIRKSLYLCPICKTQLSLGQGHLFHIIPIKLLSENNCINLVSNEYNLLYSCKTCNLKQRDKIYSECLEGELLTIWERIKCTS